MTPRTRVFSAPVPVEPGGPLEVAKVLKVEDLRVPIHIALGFYEGATDEELDDFIIDLKHERGRRDSFRPA